MESHTVCKHTSPSGKGAAVGTSIVCVNTGEEFYSIREASRVTGCDRSAIAMVLKGKYSQTRGLKFEYKR